MVILLASLRKTREIRPFKITCVWKDANLKMLYEHKLVTDVDLLFVSLWKLKIFLIFSSVIIVINYFSMSRTSAIASRSPDPSKPVQKIYGVGKVLKPTKPVNYNRNAPSYLWRKEKAKLDKQIKQVKKEVLQSGNRLFDSVKLVKLDKPSSKIKK